VKHLHRFIVLVFVLLWGTAFAQNSDDKTVTRNGKKYYLHVVKKGETVYGLSKDYSIAAHDIVNENPKAMSGISAGDTLRIPTGGAATTAVQDTTVKGPYIYHKVVAKETLYSLAKQYNVSISTLDSLNPELTTKGLVAGHTIRIPTGQPQAKSQPPVQTQPTVGEHIITKETPPVVTQKDTTQQKKAFQDLVKQQHIDSVKKANPPVVTQPVQPTVTQPMQPNQTFTPVVQNGKMLSRYNVALIMPFASENADTMKMTRLLDGSEQLPLLTQISSDLYQGVMIALDSLKKQGIRVDLHLYNITSSSDTSIYRLDSILKSPTFAMSNLIIGPPSSAHFKQVARYAAAHNIAIVTPIVNDNAVIRNNPFTSKPTPSTLTEVEEMADYITAHYMKSNIVLLHHRDVVDEAYYEDFQKRFKADVSVSSETDSVISADYSDNLEILGGKLKDNKNNVIVAPYQGASFVAKFVNKLANSKYFDNDSIVLFGMHNWLNIDALDMANLDTLNFHYPSNEYINYSDSCTKGFIRKFRARYYTEPSYYACQGFDIAFYYIGLLQKYGTAMQDHLGDVKYKGAHTSFDFHKLDDKSGYDNKAIYILEYRNYNIVKDNF